MAARYPSDPHRRARQRQEDIAHAVGVIAGLLALLAIYLSS